MNDLMYLSFEERPIRAVEMNGEVWWVLADICKILELSNPSKVAERLDSDERANLELGRQGKTNIINESGLYSVILRSDKPEAKTFKRWITHEVLPQIHQTGSYSANKADNIMNDTTISPTAKLIFMYLHKAANGSDELIINRAQVLSDLNMGVDKYKNHLNKLKAKGYITSEPYRMPNGRISGIKFKLNYNMIMKLENKERSNL